LRDKKGGEKKSFVTFKKKDIPKAKYNREGQIVCEDGEEPLRRVCIWRDTQVFLFWWERREV